MVGLAEHEAGVSRRSDADGDSTGPLPDLRGALEAIPGCLGTEAARTESGKEVILAWFEDKRAVLRWYHSQIHRRTMRRAFPDLEPQGRLKDVRDDVGPTLAIASLRFTDQGPGEGVSLPISQIAIELYRPLAGGLSFGGRFAPDRLVVPDSGTIRSGDRRLRPGVIVYAAAGLPPEAPRANVLPEQC